MVNRRLMVRDELFREAFHRRRAESIAAISTLATASSSLELNYDSILAFLGELGIPAAHLAEGSVPRASLETIAACFREHLGGSRPLIGLHIGNFVGVSLAYLTNAAKQIHPDSIVVSVDPNIPHRGVHNPQSYVVQLLSRFQLQANSIILAGYSQKKSVSNDGVVFEGYDPVAHFSKELGCENVLANLSVITGSKFDFVFLDGNHEGAYLRREIDACTKLLRPGALLVLDDVDEHWSEIRDVFRSLNKANFTEILADRRVGIARYSLPADTR
jgi:hypothetical protein